MLFRLDVLRNCSDGFFKNDHTTYRIVSQWVLLELVVVLCGYPKLPVLVFDGFRFDWWQVSVGVDVFFETCVVFRCVFSAE